MAITIFSHSKKLGQRTRDTIKGKLLKRLSQIPLRFSKARVTLSDINGPRGGVDKECKISIHLARIGTISVSGQAETFRQAFSVAADKLTAALRRKACKQKSKGRARPLGNLPDGFVAA